MSDWKFARKGSACARCERAFVAREPFVSAIYLAPPDAESAERFVREDRCPGCFETDDREPFSRWTTRLPSETGKKPILDLGLAHEFLVRLVREDDPERRNIAYILTLLLLRKRKVKLRGQRVEGGITVMQVTVPSESGEAEIEIQARELSSPETEEITAEITTMEEPTYEESDFDDMLAAEEAIEGGEGVEFGEEFEVPYGAPVVGPEVRIGGIWAGILVVTLIAMALAGLFVMENSFRPVSPSHLTKWAAKK